MPWNITQHKAAKAQQDIKVAIIVKEMAQYSYATYAQSFEDNFKERIKEIPRKNNFSADILYKVSHRNSKSVEIWKMTVTGEFKDLMFTLDYIGKAY